MKYELGAGSAKKPKKKMTHPTFFWVKMKDFQAFYKDYGIIPIIICKKLRYHKGFTKDGIPLCPLGHKMKNKVVDYKEKESNISANKIVQLQIKQL